MSKIAARLMLRGQAVKLGLKDFVIIDDRADVHGDVDLVNHRGAGVPIMFGRVDGDFIIRTAHIDNLVGIPHHIGGDFDCSHTRIRSLAGISEKLMYVGGNFKCSSFLSVNVSTTWSQRCVSHTLGILWIPGVRHIDIDNGMHIDKIINKYVGTGDILSCQDELIDAGFVEQARL